MLFPMLVHGQESLSADGSKGKSFETGSILVPFQSQGCPPRVPAISLSAPDAFRKGYFGVLAGGMTIQSRTRFTGHFLDPDGNAGISVGLGDPEKFVGLELRTNIYGITNQVGFRNNFGAGTLEFHLTRKLKENLWVGSGIFDLISWDKAPENNLQSIYFNATTYFILPTAKQRKLFLTAGLGNGRFRTDKKFDIEKEGSLSPFGSIALELINEGNAIIEWTGYNLFSGFSFFLDKKTPFQLIVGVDDIFNDHWRFILGGSIGLHVVKNETKACFHTLGLPSPPPPQSSRN